MRKLALIPLLFLLFVLAVGAQGKQYRGQVVNRDSVPQRCQVEFFFGDNFQFGVDTDNQGYFYVTNRRGKYRVVVSQGPARDEFDVTIDEYGLNPSTLVVRW
jgi:hypothetical protein